MEKLHSSIQKATEQKLEGRNELYISSLQFSLCSFRLFTHLPILRLNLKWLNLFWTFPNYIQTMPLLRSCHLYHFCNSI